MVDEVIAVGDERVPAPLLRPRLHPAQEGRHDRPGHPQPGPGEVDVRRATWLESGELKMDGDAIEVARAYLQSVNSTESGGEDDDQHEVGLQMQGRGERRGTGEITIEAVTFISAHNRPTPFVNSGRPLVARVRYKAAQPIQNPTFGLRFFTDGGTLVTAPNSRRARFEAGTVDGEGEIVYRIPPDPPHAGHVPRHRRDLRREQPPRLRRASAGVRAAGAAGRGARHRGLHRHGWRVGQGPQEARRRPAGRLVPPSPR